MSAPSDDKYSKSSKYAPKQVSDQPQMPAAERGYITTSEHASWVEPSEELSSKRWNDQDAMLVFVIVVAVALSAIFFTKPLWQSALAPLNANSRTLQARDPSDQLTTNNTPANSSLVPATKIPAGSKAEPSATQVERDRVRKFDKNNSELEVKSSAEHDRNYSAEPLASVTKIAAGSGAEPPRRDKDRSGLGSEPPTGATKIAPGSGAEPPAGAQAQQVPGSPISRPLSQEQKSVNSLVRGVTDSEILFGISAPFSGAAKELGQNMKLGIETAFRVANASGGVHGRQLRLIAADDGYEPTRTAETMKRLYEKDQVFGVIGNVGTPTAVVALPYALDRKMCFSEHSPAPAYLGAIHPTDMFSIIEPATLKKRPPWCTIW